MNEVDLVAWPCSFGGAIRLVLMRLSGFSALSEQRKQSVLLPTPSLRRLSVQLQPLSDSQLFKPV